MRKNVLQLIGSFHQGGSERQAVQLTRLLRESGRYNVFVATLNNSGPLAGEIANMGIDEVPEYRLTSFQDRNALVQGRRFAQYLRENDIDIVHSHDFYTNIFGMAAASVARVRVRIASRRESAVRAVKQRLIERGAYKLAHQVVANCDELRQQLIEKEGLRPDKVTTLYNGLDLSRIVARDVNSEKELLTSLGLPADQNRRFITIVANLRAHFTQPKPICLKDHPTFLRAAQRVRAAVPDAAFVIAGEGELLEETRALARQLGLEQDVFFLGSCQRVAELLSASTICVLSSTAEGFPNAILEYMAAARAVVSTDVGGAREAIEEGQSGYLVKSGDDETMAARLVSLLNEPDKARAMGDRGRGIVKEKFSSEAQLARTQNLYERLLARRTQSVPGTVGDVHRGNV
ncbi:MAG TPA: glycosyltransferase [Pyrinomonadaceae bacterium]|nr:glycosyltransferase [Pyrinomonadaceae bacterium]